MHTQNSYSVLFAGHRSDRRSYSSDTGAAAGGNTAAAAGGQPVSDRAASGSAPNGSNQSESPSPNTDGQTPSVGGNGSVDGRTDSGTLGGNVSDARNGSGSDRGSSRGSSGGNNRKSGHSGDSAGSAAAGRTAGGKTEADGLAAVDLTKVPAPKKQAAPKPTKVQATNVKARTSVKAGDISPDELTEFILGVFGILATVGGEHWMLLEAEAETISKPLTSILNKMNKKKKENVNTMMAPMLLITAIGTIVLPRAVITLSQLKEKKAHARNNAANRASTSGRLTAAPIRDNRSVSSEAAGTIVSNAVQEQESNGLDGGNSVPAVPAYLFETLNE